MQYFYKFFRKALLLFKVSGSSMLLDNKLQKESGKSDERKTDAFYAGQIWK